MRRAEAVVVMGDEGTRMRLAEAVVVMGDEGTWVRGGEVARAAVGYGDTGVGRGAR